MDGRIDNKESIGEDKIQIEIRDKIRPSSSQIPNDKFP